MLKNEKMLYVNGVNVVIIKIRITTWKIPKSQYLIKNKRIQNYKYLIKSIFPCIEKKKDYQEKYKNIIK